MLFGSFLAVETRKIKFDAVNDSHAIGASIYNVALLSLVAVVVNFSIRNNPTLLYLINSAIIFVATTSTQVIIFAPKVGARNQVDIRTGGGETTLQPTATAGGKQVDDEKQ